MLFVKTTPPGMARNLVYPENMQTVVSMMGYDLDFKYIPFNPRSPKAGVSNSGL